MSIVDMTPIQDFVMKCVGEEFMRASNTFPVFHSDHEGYAVIQEELDELWDAIKHNKTTSNAERIREAIQVGAMAMRYVHDLATEQTLDGL